jgi:hypothetical protein
MGTSPHLWAKNKTNVRVPSWRSFREDSPMPEPTVNEQDDLLIEVLDTEDDQLAVLPAHIVPV